MRPAAPSDEHPAFERADLLRIALALLAAAASRAGLLRDALGFDAIALAATLFGGYPIHARRWRAWSSDE